MVGPTKKGIVEAIFLFFHFFTSLPFSFFPYICSISLPSQSFDYVEVGFASQFDLPGVENRLRTNRMLVDCKKTLLFITFLLIALPLLAQQQQGKASYYSKRATGARTASGERLHHDSLTCAHRTYPFGTLLKVKNPGNGRSVVVRVTDRGPFKRGRIIDLSYAAAKELGILANGVATVIVEKYNKGVPYLDEDSVNLPQIDFEVATAGHSIVEDWKNKESVVKKKMDRNAKEIASERKQEQAKKPAKQPEEADKGNKPVPAKKEKENRWNSVFERLKGMF